MGCAGCREGKGMTFVFEGRWVDAPGESNIFSVIIRSGGEHQGEAATVRRQAGSATVREKKRIEALAGKLWSETQVVRPQDVAKEVLIATGTCPRAFVLKNIVTRWRRKKQASLGLHSQNRLVTWRKDFEDFAKKKSTADEHVQI